MGLAASAAGLRRVRAHVQAVYAAAAAPDWSSGTRIGDALREFNDRHGRRGMARGAVIVILSDGWERGDPMLVGREMERLARLAHRIVWASVATVDRAGIGRDPCWYPFGIRPVDAIRRRPGQGWYSSHGRRTPAQVVPSRRPITVSHTGCSHPRGVFHSGRAR